MFDCDPLHFNELIKVHGLLLTTENGMVCQHDRRFMGIVFLKSVENAIQNLSETSKQKHWDSGQTRQSESVKNLVLLVENDGHVVGRCTT